MHVKTVIALLLVAGCAAPPNDQGATSPTAPDTVLTLPTRIAFQHCDELDFYFPQDVSGIDMGGLRPQHIDPADQFANMLVTGMRCSQVDNGSGFADDPTAMFFMVSVEPDPGLRIEDVSAYVWIGAIVTSTQILIDSFGPRLEHDVATVELEFSPVGGNPKARSAMTVAFEGGEMIADATMVGMQSQGQSGKMAAYIGDSKKGLELFLISFSDYRFYSDGVATATSMMDFVPAPADHPAPYPAYHNVDFDVTFDRIPSVRN